MHALRVGQEPDQSVEADPTLWDEARRKCVFDGKKAALSRRAGKRHGGMFPIRKRSWFPGRGRRVGPRFGDTTTQFWVSVGRKSQIFLSGKFATFRMKLTPSCHLDASFWRVEVMLN